MFNRSMTAAVQNANTGRRTIRRPVHNFNLRTKPYVLQPAAILPVLPGETMRNSLLRSRVVSDPIANPLIGWWKQYGWFYVKLSDLPDAEFTEMHIDPSTVVPTDDYMSPGYYYNLGGADPETSSVAVDWARRCLAKIVEDHFRNEGEGVYDHMIDGLPIASVRRESWWNSAMLSDAYDRPDMPVDADEDGTIMASEVDQVMRQYQLLVQHNLVDMSYEDYLATFGVRVPKAELKQSEILRYVEQWTYPTNTVNPSNGVPSSAVVWSVDERADKDRFFREPGFIVLVTCTRPKVYFRNQYQPGVAMMTDGMSWLPAVASGDNLASLRYFNNYSLNDSLDQEGPLRTEGAGYWVDLKDLLIYGDQFVNYDPSAVSDANFVDLPASDLQRYYVDADDITALFSGGGSYIREDGVLTTMIAGRQVDTTPRTPVLPT